MLQSDDSCLLLYHGDSKTRSSKTLRQMAILVVHLHHFNWKGQKHSYLRRTAKCAMSGEILLIAVQLYKNPI